MGAELLELRGNSALDEERHREAEAALRRLTNKIHSSTLDELFDVLSVDLLEIFQAERCAIYVVDYLKDEIFSRLRDSEEVKEIRVPISTRSLSGFVAATGKIVRIADAYDDAELKTYSDDLTFDATWDKRTGLRTKQVLAVPIKSRKRVEGVIQLVNNRNGKPFTKRHVETLQEIAETLSIAFTQKRQLEVRRSPWDLLFSNDQINEEMLEKAQVKAAEEHCSDAAVLIDEFKVPKRAILESFAQFYRTPPIEFEKGMAPPLIRWR